MAKPGSPAAKVGFQPFDYSKAGVYGAPEWIALAKAVEYPPVEFAPPPPPPLPLTFREDFEAAPVGSPASYATTHLARKGDAANVAVPLGPTRAASHRPAVIAANSMQRAAFPYGNWRMVTLGRF